ncbi:MAG: cohesin domain-containing protein [bacterium]
MDKKLVLVTISLMLAAFSVSSATAEAAEASLYLAPSQGTFFAGSTFSVSVYLNTKGESINAVQVDLKFPAEMLQVTLPSTGESFVSEWLTPPSYSNTGGVISFRGGIPGGVVTSSGLISTITFRAKASGTAKIEFLDSSRVFLNDGKGTPVSTFINNGSYRIIVPPPEGPAITSLTYPDPEIWYCDNSPSFAWEKDSGITDFSYSFSQNPRENPDTVSEGEQVMISYEKPDDGVWYFHLRAREQGVWGLASHRTAKIDCSPPEKFDIQVDTNSGFIYFETKDFYSGIDYYEVNMFNTDESFAGFFIEATSPFKIPREETGGVIR